LNSIGAEDFVTQNIFVADDEIIYRSLVGYPLQKPESSPRFGDLTWNISALNSTPSGDCAVINWNRVPIEFRKTLKYLIWILINCWSSLEYPHEDGRKWLARLTPGSMLSLYRHWCIFTRWLITRGVTSLSDVDDTDFRDFEIRLVTDPGTRNNCALHFQSIKRLWIVSQLLTDGDRLRKPTWLDHGYDVVRIPTKNENTTHPVHPATMSPMLIWAVRFVLDFSQDIIRAASARDELDRRPLAAWRDGGLPAARAYLDTLCEGNHSLPAAYDNLGRITIAGAYIGALLGFRSSDVRQALQRLYPGRVSLQIGAPLPVEVLGQVHGLFWKSSIDYYEIKLLCTRLETACMIVIAYLSGMRPEEVLSLERGCATIATVENNAKRYEIHGKTFKGVLDEGATGRLPGGKVREEPWTVIEVVVRAVEVLESLNDSRQLFPAVPTAISKRVGAALSTAGARARLNDFIGWVNQYAEDRGLAAETIPEDAEGAVTLRRLRRTCAWFIARLPGGRIALGAQYGHLRLHTSEGYSGRAADGWHKLIAVEDMRALAARLQEAYELLDAGGYVSGPAAGRFISGVLSAPSEFMGNYMSDRQARALENSSTFRIYDNGSQFLNCVFDASKALCSVVARRGINSVQSTPSVDHCQSACQNIARTDSDMHRASIEASRLTVLSQNVLLPQPLRLRYIQRAAHFENIIATHEAERKKAESGP